MAAAPSFRLVFADSKLTGRGALSISVRPRITTYNGSMAIFSRRTLQRLLKATAPLLTPAQRTERLQKLNTTKSLDTEWEVITLFALSKCGKVSHEPDLGGVTRPDVFFRDSTLEFVADVVTVSDKGYEEASPLDEFTKEVARRLQRSGLTMAGFNYHVESEKKGPKARLMLPAKSNWNVFFDQKFRDLVAAVKANPTVRWGIHQQGPGLDVKLIYTPGQDSTGGSFPAYRWSSDTSQNPIANRLNDKRDQLKRSGFNGLRGIFVCDGDCEALARPEPIVKRFLKGTSSVAFVAIMTVDGNRFAKQNGIRVVSKCYINPKIDDAARQNTLKELIEQRVPEGLPPANDDVRNCLYHLRSKHGSVGLGHHGGSSWDGTRLKISARVIHELLAGRLTTDEL